MTKTQLKPGMMTIYRNGKKRIVTPVGNGELILADPRSRNFLPLDDYDDNLDFLGRTQRNNADWDVVRVYGLSDDEHDAFTLDENKRPLLDSRDRGCVRVEVRGCGKIRRCNEEQNAVAAAQQVNEAIDRFVDEILRG